MDVLRNIGSVPEQAYPAGDICLQILAIETMLFFKKDQDKTGPREVHVLTMKEPAEYEVVRGTIPLLAARGAILTKPGSKSTVH